MEVIGPILGVMLIGWALWMMISTLVLIQESVGIVSRTGLPWAVLVIVCNLAGVILYRRFREPVEKYAKRSFRRGLQ